MFDSTRILCLRGAGRVLGLCLLLGFLVAPLLGAGSPGGPGGGNFASGEMVGTLPATQGWECATGSLLDPDAQPGFYIEGSWQSVLRAVQFASGTGHVTLEAGSAGDLRAVLHGKLRLDLHPRTFHGENLRAGLLFGAEHGVSAVGMFHGGRMVSMAAHGDRSALPVPVAHLVDSGVLEEGVILVTARPERGRSITSLRLHGGTLSISQSF